VSGTNPFTVTITAADTDCGELRTLAMTGVFGVPIYLAGASVLFLLGVTIVMITIYRRNLQQH